VSTRSQNAAPQTLPIQYINLAGESHQKAIIKPQFGHQANCSTLYQSLRDSWGEDGRNGTAHISAINGGGEWQQRTQLGLGRCLGISFVLGICGR
jgi:hypothetical protein